MTTRSVADYGATGDGATDDTAAISAAIAACASGDTVTFPAGTFVASGITAPTSPLTLSSSAGAIIKNLNGVGYLTPGALCWSDVAGLTFSGLTFDGNKTGCTVSAAFRLIRCSATITNCTFQNGYQIGMDLQCCSATVTGCTALTNGTAAGSFCVGFYVRDDSLGVNSSTMTMTNCVGHDNTCSTGGTVEGAGLHVQGTANMTVSGFTGYNNGHYGIKEQAAAGTGTYSAITVYANKYGMSTPAGHNRTIDGLVSHDNTFYGFWFDAACQNIALKNATISNSGTYGIRFQGAQNCSVTDATITNSGASNVSGASYGGVACSGLAFLRINTTNPGLGTDPNNANGFDFSAAGCVNGAELRHCFAHDTRSGTARSKYSFTFNGPVSWQRETCAGEGSRFGEIQYPENITRLSPPSTGLRGGW